MKAIFKITSKLAERVRLDLARTHPFAMERVGFLVCKVGALPNRGVMILAHDYRAVEDGDYINDPTVGAMMGPGAIRKALQFAYHNEVCMFHVHPHDHLGAPWFSRVDLREGRKFVPDFWNVRPHLPHGLLVLSRDSGAGLCWHPQLNAPLRFEEVIFVGSPTINVRSCYD